MRREVLKAARPEREVEVLKEGGRLGIGATWRGKSSGNKKISIWLMLTI